MTFVPCYNTNFNGSCEHETEIGDWVTSRALQFFYTETYIDQNSRDYETIVQRRRNDLTFIHIVRNVAVSANHLIRRGVLRTKHREIETYFASQEPRFHFKESSELTGSVYLRADKYAETTVIDELETTALLSLIGGLWSAIIGPIGVIVRLLATQHFKALMIKSVFSFNNYDQASADSKDPN